MTPPPVSDPKSTFKPDLFKGKVLFCTGGRSGICYQIVETMMSLGVDGCHCWSRVSILSIYCPLGEVE